MGLAYTKMSPGLLKKKTLHRSYDENSFIAYIPSVNVVCFNTTLNMVQRRGRWTEDLRVFTWSRPLAENPRPH